MEIEVRIYDDGNDNRGQKVGVFASEPAARRAAAKALGHCTMRGSAQWVTKTGICFQFGRRDDTDFNPVAELIWS